MVDPNRKINRLTEEDISFLDECEELFSNRFSEYDEQFMKHCEKPLSEPPVVMNFVNGGGGGGSGGGHFAQGNSYRGRYNDNRQNYRGGHGGGPIRNQNYNRRNHVYGRDNGDGHSNRFRHHSNRNYRNSTNRNEDQRSSSMNFRRDYGNFVPASTNDGAS